MEENKEVIIILSISSDIGKYLAKRYLEEGKIVVGTYRNEGNIEDLKGLENLSLYPCDLSNSESVEKFVRGLKEKGVRWNLFISCVGNPLPLESFFNSDFKEWENSVNLNSINQLEVLHEIYELRNKDKISRVVFFASGGINNAVVNFSAYTIGKIFLIKMCEYLDAENEDLSVFIVGPGWVKTKTHDLILENLNEGDERYGKTVDFLKNREGTDLEDIFKCVDWLSKQDKEIVSGRNFSVVHDDWKKGDELSLNLKDNPDIFKLRRFEGK